MLHKVQELMSEFRLTGEVSAPDEPSAAHIHGPQRGNAMAEALAEYQSLDRDALLNDPEYLAFLARFMAAFKVYVGLNRRTAGAGMASLGRMIFRIISKIFQSRLCTFQGSAS
jgi:hypothetical protein